MNSEIATSVMLGLKLTIVLLDNRGFGCINRLQMATGGANFNNLLKDTRHEVLPEIDFAKHAEATGLSREEALVEAGGVRLRPIVMTSVAIVAGMIPVAIGAGEGADFRAPLGRAVIGGVITSTVLTLLVIPTFYDIITRWRDALGHRLRRKKVTHVPAHAVARAEPPPASTPPPDEPSQN
jgi:hypothetical protein